MNRGRIMRTFCVSHLSLSMKRKTFYSTAKNLGCYDVVIVGGGIVGTATGRELKKRIPNLKCAIVEKEDRLAYHQSGHNSGVIHAGIYYKPGSEKAKLCTEGMNLAYDYLSENNIPYKKVGKLIVATDESQLPTLNMLMERGLANKVVGIKMIGPEEIKKIEPHCVGMKAIHSPNTGIVDWGLVTKCFGEDFKKMGGDIHFGFEVCSFIDCPGSDNGNSSKYPVRISSSNKQDIQAGFVLCCAGLYADKLSVLTGGPAEPAIVPFRGEYLQLRPEKQHLVNGNIYPVPDPRFPFLGVHFTPKMDGSVLLGPNAVLAFKREGYRYTDISLSELMESLKYKGFQRIVLKHYKYGMQEMAKSLFTRLQVRELQKFVPEIKVSDIRSGPSGVRAQALDINGDLVEDFVFEGGDKKNPRILHCLNAPSPAATSSLAIAKVLTEKVSPLILH